MLKSWIVTALLTILIGACTAPLVDEGVAKFQAGNIQATALLKSDAEAVDATGRFTTLFAFLGAKGPTDVGKADRPSPARFADYVCTQSTKFAALRAFQAGINEAKVAEKEARLGARKTEDEQRADLGLAVGACTVEVHGYVTLRQEHLPAVGLLPRSKNDKQAGFVGLTLASAGALIGLVAAGVSVLSSAWDGLKAEARAADIKQKVRSQDIQQVVREGLGALSKTDPDLENFCTKDVDDSRSVICKNLRPKPKEQAQTEHYEIRQSVDGSSDVCQNLVEVRVPQPRNAYPVMDTATLIRRWLALRMAYYRYKDMYQFQEPPTPSAMVPAFESRRKALEASVADYFAVKPGIDIVEQQRQAWADLTALSCGKLSPEQMLVAMNAFVARMTAINDGYGKVSTALDAYTKATTPPAPQ